MSNLLDTAQKLRDLKIEFDISLEENWPEFDAIKLVTEKLEKQANGNVNIPDSFDIKILSMRISDRFKRTGSIGTLSVKECKNLPFILSDINDDALIESAFNLIRRNESIAMLKREVFVYFREYEQSNYISALAKDITKKLLKFSGRNRFLNTLKDHIYLFTPNSQKIVVQNCIQKGFFEYFQGLNFTAMLMESKYVVSMLKNLYQEKNFILDKQIKLFRTLFSDERLRKVFTNSLPFVIGRLIVDVDICNRSDKKQLKEEIRIIALKELGEPRVRRSRNSKWILAGDRAKAIFIRWVSRYDFDLFFKIINDSIPSSDTHARRMWLERENFWKTYKDYISMAWVCFGAEARARVRHDNILYGDFKGSGDRNKSCIVMEIGNFTFVERSHNGSLKVWKSDKAPFIIGTEEVAEKDLVASMCLDSWTHSYSSNKIWQGKVGNFINYYCGIKPRPELW